MGNHPPSRQRRLRLQYWLSALWRSAAGRSGSPHGVVTGSCSSPNLRTLPRRNDHSAYIPDLTRAGPMNPGSRACLKGVRDAIRADDSLRGRSHPGVSAMTHISGPDFLSIQVRDLQRSAGFYERELGLQPMAGSPPGVVAFQTSPIPFAVREPLPGTDLDVGPAGLGVLLSLRADDAQ